MEELLREEIALVQERGEPVIIDDASTLLATAGASRLHALLLLPLITARGVIGLIVAARETAYHWAIDDILPGLTLATHAASAIENARQFTTLQQHARRIEALNALTQLLGAFSDPGQHLEAILQRIVEIMALDTGMTLLWDQHTECLTLATHYGLTEAIPTDLCTFTLRPLYEIASLVATTGNSLLVCRLEEERQGIHQTLDIVGFCDMMVVPLTAGCTIFGVLLVGSHAHHKLTKDDLALFSAIGQQLGLALTNARLQHTANETEAMREAEQLKSKFITAVSHDLQSPLTAIQASVESLLDQQEAHTLQTQKHLLQNIAAQAGRLDQLVEQLLDISRIEAGLLSLDRDWIELPVLLSDTLAKFAVLHDDCRVEHDLMEAMPLLYVDADRIVQVVWNLLENARKYAPRGAVIKLEARWMGNEALIDIADCGPGIPACDREKVFQRFYRLKRDQRKLVRGSGLGLAICQGIVQAHGGRIWVEERAGGGSIFRFTLPAASSTLFDPELL
jgi:K+-sensing histidine kinase KdpD